MTKDIIKWRGIPTSAVKKNETEAKTITNRYGQKSFSLPRIDDKKRWAGFPGLTGWSIQIADIISKFDFDYYIEPFAGAARVFQELIKIKNVSGMVLNDKSNFVYEWLEREFSKKVMAVTRLDFIECIKIWDSPKAFFLLDMPWNKNFYLQDFACFNRDTVTEYDNQVLSLCSGIPFEEFNKEGYKLEGKFIITTRKENRRMLRSDFNKYLIKSTYQVSGHLPILLLTTNLELPGLKKMK